jgi:prepilin-type N-terminal cleavage/methylation domain-containing protein
MNRRSTADPVRAGFSLTELLVVIGVFSIFALAASKLTQTTIRVGHDAGYGQMSASQFDAAGRTMGHEVWGASDITLKGERAMTLKMADGATIDWTVDPQGTFTRTQQGEPPRKWIARAAGASLTREGVVVVIHLSETKASRGGEVRLISQMILAQKMAS